MTPSVDSRVNAKSQVMIYKEKKELATSDMLRMMEETMKN
jgi:hypothetical protein